MSDKANMLDRVARLGLRPGLLLLAPFLATLDVFVANLRVIRDITQASDMFGSVAPAMMATCLAACLIFISMPKARAPLHRLTRNRMIVFGLVYTAAQVAFWMLAIAVPPFSRIAIWAVGALMGLCVIPIFIAWQARYGTDFRSVLLHGSLTAVLTVALSAMILQLDAMPAAFVWCACTALGALAPAFLQNQVGDNDAECDEKMGCEKQVSAEAETPAGEAPANQPSEGRTTPRRNQLVSLLSGLWLPLLGLLICMLCSCMSETNIGGRPMRGEFTALLVSAVMALVLSCMRQRTPLTVVVDKLAAPAVVALAIVVGSLSDAGSGKLIGASLSLAPVMFMSLYALASLAAVQGPLRTLVASIVLAACCLAMLAGSLLTLCLPSQEATGPVVRIITFAYYSVILVNLGYVAWKLLVERDDAATQRIVAETNQESPAEARHANAATLAQACGLTAREGEILEQLAAGHNSRYIATALIISDSTMRTHMRSIYRKLGVSSQSELIVLVSEGASNARQGKNAEEC